MTDIRNGLSSEEAKKLKEDGLDNIPVGNQSKTIGQIVAGNVLTYFNFVFAVFAGLLIFVGSYNNMTFLPIIILKSDTDSFKTSTVFIIPPVKIIS